MEDFLLIQFAVLSGILGRLVGSKKGAGTAGEISGLLLGPVGVILVLLPAFIDTRHCCPTCGTRSHQQPAMCPACKTTFKWKGKECEFFPPK